MKKIRVLFIAVLLLSAGSSLQQLSAQEKTKEEQEKELKIQMAIEQQKKAMTEQKKAQEEASQVLKEKQFEMQKSLKDIKIIVESADPVDEAITIPGWRGQRSFKFDEPFNISPGVEAYYDHSFGGDSERTTWDFSKSVKENTFSRDYTFDVEKTVNTVVMSVMGDCKAGEIRIRIIMPSGKNYSDIVIDEFGNLNWRKSFTISETENQDKAGEWKFQISSSKATGFFKISLQTY
jgi:type II secretory pathway pseudopilin PulG